MDVQQFTPNEITVKTTDKYIIVEGKHEEKQDEHGYISRQFVRRYQLPGKTSLTLMTKPVAFMKLTFANIRIFAAEINPNEIASTLSSDGVLTVTAPLVQKPQVNAERVVPIQQTGPTKTDVTDKVAHST